MPVTVHPAPANATSASYQAVDAGDDLSTVRPSDAVAVYWLFDDGVDVGVDGANIVNAVPGDTYHVRPA